MSASEKLSLLKIEKRMPFTTAAVLKERFFNFIFGFGRKDEMELIGQSTIYLILHLAVFRALLEIVFIKQAQRVKICHYKNRIS